MRTTWHEALAEMGSGSTAVVAPDVVARLASAAGGDRETLVSYGTLLSPGQLTGLVILPDPLPAVSSSAGGFDPQDLTPADRRLLLIAALSRSGQVGPVLDAAAVAVDRLLAKPVHAVLQVHKGHVRLEPHARHRLLATASPSEIADGHASLARANKLLQHLGHAAWHRTHAQPIASLRLSATDVAALLRLARQQLRAGAVHSAQRTAETGATAALMTGRNKARGSALELAATAALWSGHLHDAQRLLALAASVTSRAPRRDLADAVAILLEGPPDGANPLHRMNEQAHILAAVTGATADRVIFSKLHQVADTWWDDPEQADLLFARLALSTGRAQPEAVAGGHAAPSPIAEALVQIGQVTLQLFTGDEAAAAVTFEDSLSRLPMAIAGGGVVGSFARLLLPHLQAETVDVVEVLDKLAPANPVRYQGSGDLIGESWAIDGLDAGAGDTYGPNGSSSTTAAQRCASCLGKPPGSCAVVETIQCAGAGGPAVTGPRPGQALDRGESWSVAQHSQRAPVQDVQEGGGA